MQMPDFSIHISNKQNDTLKKKSSRLSSNLSVGLTPKKFRGGSVSELKSFASVKS
jgi:hypothetical protein